MRTEWLYYFSVLAEHLNYRKAAQALFISQQALSQNMQQLEASLGFSLILRHKRRVMGLTPAGEAFLQQSKRLLERLKHVETRLHVLSEEHLIVGVGSEHLLWGLENTFLELTQAFPQLRVALRPLPFQQLEQALLNGEIDLALDTAVLNGAGLTGFSLRSRPFAMLGTRIWTEVPSSQRPFIRCQPELKPTLKGEVLSPDWPQPIGLTEICCTNQVDLALSLACSGLGTVYLPLDLAQGPLEEGVLCIYREIDTLGIFKRAVSWVKDLKLGEATVWLLQRWASQAQYTLITDSKSHQVQEPVKATPQQK